MKTTDLFPLERYSSTLNMTTEMNTITNFDFYNAVLQYGIGMAKRIGSDQTGLHCMFRRIYSDYSLLDLRLPGLLLHYYPNNIAQYDSIDH